MTFILLVVAAASPVSVASPGFQVVGLEPVVAEALLDRFVTQLSASGAVKVTTAKDIAQALGVERQKQLLGCGTETTECLAELAGSMGADVVFSGNIVKVGNGFTVNVRFVQVKDGKMLVSASERVPDLDNLQYWLDRVAQAASERLGGPLAVPGSIIHASSAPVRSPWPWVAGGASVAVAGLGLGLFLSGKADFTELQQTSASARIEQLVVDGPAKQRAGVGLMIGGGAALVGSLLWGILRKDDTTTVGVIASPQGAGVFVQGSWQ